MIANIFGTREVIGMWHRRVAVTIITVALAGCGLSIGGSKTPDFVGAIVSDEPSATQAGYDVLAAGGNAADAATATYFALAVTLPSMATLAGGGVCLVYDNQSNKAETLEFYALSPSESTVAATRPSAVPGNVRGFFALHTRFGQLQWSDVLFPSEVLARRGAIVSEALSEHIRLTAQLIFQNAEARQLFMSDSGRPKQRGDVLRQLDLATVIAQMRGRGPGEFYTGRLAQQLVRDTQAAGGGLTIDDLRSMRPKWRRAVHSQFGEIDLVMPAAPAAAGLTSARIWRTVTALEGKGKTGPVDQAHYFAEAAMRAYVDRNADVVEFSYDGDAKTFLDRGDRSLSAIKRRQHTQLVDFPVIPEAILENPAGTGFSVIDHNGNAVACTVTPNNTFGTGRVAPRTGIVVAAAPVIANGGPLSLGPVLAIDFKEKKAHLAATGIGGVAGPTALAQVLLGVGARGRTLEEAIFEPRLHHSGNPDFLYHESELSAATVSGLVARGHDVRVFPGSGKGPALVNSIFCADGLPNGDIPCEAIADPRGYGLGLGHQITN